MTGSSTDQQHLLDNCLDALDDIYDQREFAEVGAYRLFAATAAALSDTPWSALLSDAAAALRTLVYSELDPIVRNRRALEATGHFRLCLAAQNDPTEHEQ